MKTNLIDDGQRTYRALNIFEWNGGPIQETPWGLAAYVGTGSPGPMATGRNGGWFGTANGRTWSNNVFEITKTPEDARYGLNAQDIYEVRAEFGGGFVPYGRHDIGLDVPCPFGTLYQKRFSVGEIKSRVAMMKIVFINNIGVMFDTRESCSSEYRGDGNFTIKTEILTGTRAELAIPGMSIQKMGWTMENDETAQFIIARETVSDNNGIFAVRNIAIGRA